MLTVDAFPQVPALKFLVVRVVVVFLLAAAGCGAAASDSATPPDPVGASEGVAGKHDQAGHAAQDPIGRHVEHLSWVSERLGELIAYVDAGDLSPEDFWFLLGPVRDQNDRDVARLGAAAREGEIDEAFANRSIDFVERLSAALLRYEAEHAEGELAWKDVAFLVEAWRDRIDAELTLFQ